MIGTTYRDFENAILNLARVYDELFYSKSQFLSAEGDNDYAGQLYDAIKVCVDVYNTGELGGFLKCSLSEDRSSIEIKKE
jgi:hypothetical protein